MTENKTLNGARYTVPRRINNYLITGCALLFAIAFWNRNDIPANLDFAPGLAEEPRQRPVSKKPFTVEYEGVDYLIEPEYAYEIYGMIVSYRQHDGASRMHRRANDHLNMADLCVVWGDTAFSGELNKLSFRNGIFTCNVQTSDPGVWARFNMDQLSNNHLLSSDRHIRKRVRRVGVGDQVRVVGWLSSYSSGGGGKRGTSTTRTDSGDGACETIYVREFEIIDSTLGPWRVAMYLSLAVLLLTLFIHFQRPYRPYA